MPEKPILKVEGQWFEVEGFRRPSMDRLFLTNHLAVLRCNSNTFSADRLILVPTDPPTPEGFEEREKAVEELVLAAKELVAEGTRDFPPRTHLILNDLARLADALTPLTERERFTVEFYDNPEGGDRLAKVCDRDDGRCWPVTSGAESLAAHMNELHQGEKND